jgi:sulfate transport system ATP-binding protein
VIETDPHSNGVSARVDRVIHLGWEIQVELMMLADGQHLTVHMNREQFQELKLQPEQRVYVKLKEIPSTSFSYSI